MKLKHLLVMAAMAVFGCGSALADEWSINFAEIGDNNELSDKAGATISTAVSNGMGTVTLGEELNSNFGIQTGTSWIYRTAQKALYSSNSGGRNFGVFNAIKDQLITLEISAAPTPTNATLQSTDGNTRVYKVTADGTVTFNLARYNYIYSISVANPAATDKDYTIKYVDSDGTELKQSTVKSGAPGSNITLNATDKADFIANGQKYIYVSDDASGKTITEDNSTVVTIKYRTAETYTYNVVSSTGKAFASGSNFEGETVNSPYAKYLNIDGTLYEAPQSSGSYWSYPFTLNEDNHTETINYTATSINNVVYFTETEDIEGAVKLTGGNANVRCSMQAGGYYEGELTTLNPGKYKLATSVWGGNGTTITFKAGETTILEVTTTGSINNATSNVFVITEPTTITIEGGVNSNNSPKVTDYIYIVKTGDVFIPTPGADATSEIVNPGCDTDFTGWTHEAANGNNQMFGTSAFEYWGYNANNTSTFDYYQVISNLPNGVYKVAANMYNAQVHAGDFVPTFGVYAKSGDNEVSKAVDVMGDVFNWYETEEIVVTDGTLRIGVKNLADVLSARWCVVDEFKLTYVAPAPITRTTATEKYGTICAPFAANAEGATVYTASLNETNDAVVLVEVTEMEAGKAYIYQATENAQTFSYASGDLVSEPIASSPLVGVFTATPVPVGSYVMQTQNGEQQFYIVADGKQPTLSAYKAYLSVPTSGAKSLKIGFAEETAIKALDALTTGSAKIYDINGRELKSLQKGVNIVNGVKVMVK